MIPSTTTTTPTATAAAAAAATPAAAATSAAATTTYLHFTYYVYQRLACAVSRQIWKRTTALQGGHRPVNPLSRKITLTPPLTNTLAFHRQQALSTIMWRRGGSSEWCRCLHSTRIHGPVRPFANLAETNHSPGDVASRRSNVA